MKELAALSSKRGVDSWNVTAGLVTVQTLSMQVMHFLENVYKNGSIIQNFPAYTFL